MFPYDNTGSKISGAKSHIKVTERNRFDPSYKKKQEASAAGSGFIISSDGMIVTNHHVIDQAKPFTLAFADGVESKGTFDRSRCIDRYLRLSKPTKAISDRWFYSS